MDIRAAATITAATETITGADQVTGELLADYDLKVKLDIGRAVYLELVRAKLAGASITLQITKAQGDLFDGDKGENGAPAEKAAPA